ncbi:hypothetical protein [uncultured Bilophila sp.]|uniref:hypothetical protein n=1 Tax=uncultured Bilophila sp. TaxID=529385 RepID=UPI00280B6F7C|nr:hypothetical protein [uncultured Bilophila sp.]
MEKKAVFSPYCGDETAIFYDRAFLFKKRLQGWERREKEEKSVPLSLVEGKPGSTPPKRQPPGFRIFSDVTEVVGLGFKNWE